MAFDGRFRIRETEDEAMGAVCGLPTLQAGESLTVFGAQAERQVTAPPRNTEARLVSRLEERGIGRPSTWAAILAVLQERGYAVVQSARPRLSATGREGRPPPGRRREAGASSAAV